jgi:hypothetical protein
MINIYKDAWRALRFFASWRETFLAAGATCTQRARRFFRINAGKTNAYFFFNQEQYKWYLF